MELDSPTSPDCCQHIAKRPTPATVQLQASVSFEFELHGRAQLVLSPVRECDDNSTEPDSCTKSQPSGGLMPTPQRVKSDGCFAIRRPKSPLPYPGSISFEGLNCQSPVLLSPVRSPAAVVRRLPLGAQSPSQRNMNPFSPAVGKHGCALTFPGESLSGSGSRYVDDFEQLAQIGEGSFGTVFKCRKRVDGCVYAVKVTRKQMRSEVQRQEMLREVFALSAVSQSARRESTHIVRYFNAWWEEGRLYIQTELCSHSLEDVVERAAGPLPSDTCVLVLEHMLLGLSLIHNAGMCHLDVKVRSRRRREASVPLRGGISGAHAPCPRSPPHSSSPPRYLPPPLFGPVALSRRTSSSRVRRRSSTSWATLDSRRSTRTHST